MAYLLDVNTNPLNKGVLTENAVGIGPVTEEIIAARCHELALIAGRPATQGDYAQGRRELTGGEENDPRETLLEALPNANPWEAPAGSTGKKTPESPSEDEDDEGRSESAQLVEEGVKEANHDQMLQAAKEAQQKDRSES